MGKSSVTHLGSEALLSCIDFLLPWATLELYWLVSDVTFVKGRYSFPVSSPQDLRMIGLFGRCFLESATA